MTAKILDATAHVEKLSTGISADAREKIATQLGQVLANTMILQLKTQVYHWNVVGPLFYSLHKLTKEHYQALFAAADVIAERIRALGHLAPLNTAAIRQAADLAEESRQRSAGEMVEQLIKDHEKLVRDARESAEMAEKHGDFASHDLLTERLDFHEKAIWMLRAITA